MVYNELFVEPRINYKHCVRKPNVRECIHRLMNYRILALWSDLDRWRSLSIISKWVVTVGQPWYLKFCTLISISNPSVYLKFFILISIPNLSHSYQYFLERIGKYYYPMLFQNFEIIISRFLHFDSIFIGGVGFFVIFFCAILVLFQER